MAENTNKNKLGINNQKLMLLSLGNAISGPPTIKGKRKFPNPPIKAGITIKNIINKACDFITFTLTKTNKTRVYSMKGKLVIYN